MRRLTSPPAGYSASGTAVSTAAAALEEMNAAVRAFCKDTSIPNTGASRVRAMPSMTPVVSTTLTVTRAGSPRGRRICARARFAVCKARPRSSRTSAAVRGCTASVPARGRKRSTFAASTSTNASRPGIVERVRADARCRLPERDASSSGGRRCSPVLQPEHPATPSIAENAGALAGSAARSANAESLKRNVLPSAVMRSARRSSGAAKPNVAASAMRSSRSGRCPEMSRSRPYTPSAITPTPPTGVPLLYKRQAARIRRQSERRALGRPRQRHHRRTGALRSEHGNWLNCTPKSGPPGASDSPGLKCSCTIWLAVRVVNALPSLERIRRGHRLRDRRHRVRHDVDPFQPAIHR